MWNLVLEIILLVTIPLFVYDLYLAVYVFNGSIAYAAYDVWAHISGGTVRSRRERIL